jgi:hypothetical protein
MDQRRSAQVKSIWDVRIYKRRTGRPKTWWPDPFKRAAGGQWSRADKYWSECSRYTQHSWKRCYKLHRHKQQVATPVYFVNASCSVPDWSESVFHFLSVYAKSVGLVTLFRKTLLTELELVIIERYSPTIKITHWHTCSFENSVNSPINDFVSVRK